MKITRAEFAGSSTNVTQKPSALHPGTDFPEFAFIGRSNVGKSSLVNMLCGRQIANTSSKPGKTRLVNHFLMNGTWYLVDLPGYGYARLPGSERAKIEEVIRNYLNRSAELRLLFILIDSRHDLTGTDADFLREIAGSDIPYAIIFTKADKQGPVATQRQVDRIKEQMVPILGQTPACFVSSSEKGTGKEDILNHIQNILSTI